MRTPSTTSNGKYTRELRLILVSLEGVTVTFASLKNWPFSKRQEARAHLKVWTWKQVLSVQLFSERHITRMTRSIPVTPFTARYYPPLLFCRFLTPFAPASNPSFFCVLTIQLFSSTQHFAIHLFTCSIVLTKTTSRSVDRKLIILSFWIVTSPRVALRETNCKKFKIFHHRVYGFYAKLYTKTAVSRTFNRARKIEF